MTLEEAIEEVRAGNVRRWGVVDTKPTAVATILNAVASGQLVPAERKCPIGISPEAHEICSAGTCDVCTASLRERLVQAKADANLAVAEALRKAGEAVRAILAGDADHVRKQHPQVAEDRDEYALELHDAILAFANQDYLAEVQALRAERDSFRAVLEGAGYGDIDGIAKNTPEMSRMLGDAVMHLTLRQRARAEAAEAEVARLKNLLGRYAGHVGEEEGTDFLNYGGDHLTDAQCKEIRAIFNAYRITIGREPLE